MIEVRRRNRSRSTPASPGSTRTTASASATTTTPSNVGHGLLLVSNDDLVRAGTGFSTHPHQDMEIVTWVLNGELEHKDSEGNRGILYPGLAQRMSAGTGIWHSEMNPSRDEDVHFVQMWVPPDTERHRPVVRAARHQRRARRGWPRARRVGAWPRRSDPASARATRCCGPDGSRPVSSSPSRTRSGCTSSSLVAVCRSTAAGSSRVTPCASPVPVSWR